MAAFGGWAIVNRFAQAGQSTVPAGQVRARSSHTGTLRIEAGVGGAQVAAQRSLQLDQADVGVEVGCDDG